MGPTARRPPPRPPSAWKVTLCLCLTRPTETPQSLDLRSNPPVPSEKKSLPLMLMSARAWRLVKREDARVDPSVRRSSKDRASQEDIGQRHINLSSRTPPEAKSPVLPERRGNLRWHHCSRRFGYSQTCAHTQLNTQPKQKVFPLAYGLNTAAGCSGEKGARYCKWRTQF
jgi:hypothetical protein